MKKIIFLIMISVVSFICLPSVYAELYKYVDENGVVSYTDDYSLVPESAKKSMETFEEIQSNETTTTSSESKVEADGDKSVTEKGVKDGMSFKDLNILKNKLDSEKMELDKEYNYLNLEKKELAEEDKKANTKRLRRNYNEKIKELNAEIRLYLVKTKAYKKRLAEYNLEYNKE